MTTDAQWTTTESEAERTARYARYEALRHWRNSIAAERGVEPDVIISNNILMDIARRNPKTLNTLTKMDVLGNWQFDTYGQTLLNVLKGAAVQIN